MYSSEHKLIQSSYGRPFDSLLPRIGLCHNNLISDEDNEMIFLGTFLLHAQLSWSFAWVFLSWTISFHLARFIFCLWGAFE